MSELISLEQYEDNYGERIGMRYRYNPETNAALKEALPFPQFKWEPERKVWSIQNKGNVIAKSIDLLNALGYDTQFLQDRLKLFPNAQQTKADCWTEIKRTRLYLHWPFIRDERLRDEVRLSVRAISGRKFHADSKSWSIPIAQASVLHGLLEDVYPPLADAIISNGSISGEITESIERVAMSSATTLDDMDELSKRLDATLPEGLSLYPFQKVAVAFAEMSNGNCLIGDEMGIGKTISTIGFMAINPQARPAVIVSPANVKFNWKKELTKWLPAESIQVVTKGKEPIGTDDIIIINYDLMNKQYDNLMVLGPELIVLDEVHYLKNSKAKRTEATLGLAQNTPNVIALSGTAISSRPSEFFNTLNLMRPAHFSSFYDFAHRYCDAWHNGFGWDFSGASNTQELNERIRDLCIRRLKSEVLPDLPPKTRTFFPISLDNKTRQPYDIAQEEWDRKIENHYLSGEPLPQGMMLNMLSDLRHICGRIKVDYAADWINDYRQQTGNPIVVFTHHRDVMSGLAGLLTEHKVELINGSTSSKKRQAIVDDFQSGSIDILICNTIAAKEGITLTAADTVLFLEREWVPSDEEQAEDRVHRIGQESGHVHAVYLSCVGTIDEHFDRIVEQKRQVIKAVLDGGSVDERKGLVAQLVKKLKSERGWNTVEAKSYE